LNLKNNASMLITRPKDDPTTNYLFYWAGLVIDEAKKRGFRVFDLKEKRANKKELSSFIKKMGPDLLFFNGHGDPDIITGCNQEALVQSNYNENITKDRLVYALACSAAAKLGTRCVKAGAQAFIGYKNLFIFLTEQTFITRPLEDQTAALFLEPSNIVTISLIKGNSAGDAYRRSQREFKRSIRKLLIDESPQTDKSSLRFLIWDMENQACLGDQSAKV